MVGLLGYAAAGALAGAGDAMVSEGKARREAALEALRQKNSLELEDRRSQNSYNNESKLQNEKATLEGGGASGMFAGTGKDAQIMNMLAAGERDSSIKQTPEYQLAVQIYTEGQTFRDPITGEVKNAGRALPFGSGPSLPRSETATQPPISPKGTGEENPNNVDWAAWDKELEASVPGSNQKPLPTEGANLPVPQTVREMQMIDDLVSAGSLSKEDGEDFKNKIKGKNPAAAVSLENYTIPPEAKELGIEKGIKAGTGVFPRIASSLDAVQGSVTGGALGKLNPEQQKGQKQIKFLREVIVPSFANSPRFPEGEMKRIQRNLTIQDDWIQNPAAAAGKARELYSLIRSSYLPRVINSIKDPNTAAADRSDLVQQYNAMIQGMRFMENPESVISKIEGNQPSNSTESVNKVPEGIAPEDWEYMTPEERKLWLN